MTAPFDRRISALPMAHAGYMAKVGFPVPEVMTAIAISPMSFADQKAKAFRD